MKLCHNGMFLNKRELIDSVIHRQGKEVAEVVTLLKKKDKTESRTIECEKPGTHQKMFKKIFFNIFKCNCKFLRVEEPALFICVPTALSMVS